MMPGARMRFGRNPICQRDPSQCRIQEHGTTTTCMAWSQVYDGNGRLVSKDPNTSKTLMSCSTCHLKWNVITSQGKIEVQNV